MKSVYVIYHLARADFLERVRRYSFLVMLGLVVFLGYQTAIGNMALALGLYRGEYNSAWVGAMMSLIATFFIGWFGFYLVKGSVARDRETGVGQIMATTPLTGPLYLIGKWLSNFSVLMSMVTVLALGAIVIQFLQGENTQINLFAFLSPFIFLVMPHMALVAAAAVLFESVSFLQGGFGNIVYFFAFISFLPLFMENPTLKQYPAFEPTGLGLLASEMGKAVTAIYPEYNGDFTLGGGVVAATRVFTWDGVQWTPQLILARFSLITLAILSIFFAALFFDRFDPSRAKPKQRKSGTVKPDLSPVITSQALHTVQLTPLTLSPLGNKAANQFSFFGVLVAEMKLLLKGQRWWWYVIIGGIIIACLVSPSAILREFVLPVAWVWPILIWSAIGSREIHHNVQQMTFSSASPLIRQLPAQWLSGFIVTLLVSIGAIIRLAVDGETAGLLALFSGAFFIPSLALAAGVWSGTSKLFEILYMLIWYLGPLNKIMELDYIGSHGNGRPEFFIPVSIALIVFAYIGRARQIRT
ncbi:MAG TPA: hypothetical protein VK897_11610 [Anaerolineales bacterium]|nr:hypothetical protein [Anaerolineales bacterium]